MSDVPSNLIPTRITQLPVAPVADENSLMMIVYQGNNYQIRVGDLLSVAGVPTSTQVIAGTGMTGGGQLTGNVTLSIANGGVGSTQLASSGVTPGVYGTSTDIPVFTVDSTGRVTAATSIPATISGYVPTSTQVIAGNGLTGGGLLSSNVTLAASYSASAPSAGFQTGSAGAANTLARSDHQHPAVDLSADDQVDNLLGLGNGGTARSLVAAAGAIVWSGADGLYIGPVGIAGQVLVSGGAGAPTWGSALIVSDQAANVVYAGPAAGAAAPTGFRSLVNADLPASGVTANTYGSTTAIPVLTVNAKGVITSATTAAITGALSYQGAWNALTNTPALTSSVGVGGYYYVVSVAGTTNLNGITDWQVGDWAIFNGSVWQKIDQTNTVSSVNGYTGVVVLTQTDIAGTASLTTVQTLTNKTLTSPSINEILDANGNEILGLSTTASAVDFLTIKNGIGVGVPLHVYADGSSTNVGLHIQPKGSGLVTISDGTDFNKGIRFRSSGSAASAVTLLDAVATAGRVVTLPDATTTLVGRDTTDTLTNKTLTSPVLTTPILGVPQSGDFSTGSFTWPTFNQNTTGTAAGLSATLAVASGGTGATTLTGYVKGNGTSAMTASSTVPSTDITGLGTMSTQNANSVAVTGGAVDGTTIGATTASTVKATTVTTTGTGSPTDATGQVYLNGATSNRVEWNTAGTGAPAFTTRSAGTKLLLYPSLSGSVADYAIGIDAATMWYSVPENNVSFKFKWYGATTEIASLSGTGVFTAVGGISGGTF